MFLSISACLKFFEFTNLHRGEWNHMSASPEPAKKSSRKYIEKGNIKRCHNVCDLVFLLKETWSIWQPSKISQPLLHLQSTLRIWPLSFGPCGESLESGFGQRRSCRRAGQGTSETKMERLGCSISLILWPQTMQEQMKVVKDTGVMEKRHQFLHRFCEKWVAQMFEWGQNWDTNAGTARPSVL